LSRSRELAGSLGKWHALREPDAYERAITIGWLVEDAPPHWREALAAKVFDDLGAIKGDAHRSADERTEHAIARVMPYAGNAGYAIGLVHRLRDSAWQRNALREFIRAQQPELRGDVERAIAGLANAEDRASLYTALADTDDAAERPTKLALTAAMAARTDLLHDDVLPPLADAMVRLPADHVRRMLHEQRTRMLDLERPELLRKLHALAPAVLRAHADTVSMVDAILDAQRWWP
jgi:hypothetical protein